MNYAKNMLSGLAGVILALIGPGLVNALRGISTEKAIGLAAVAGGFSEAMFSPVFWGLAVLLTLSFWAASRLHSKALRILLFWMPTLFVLVVGLSLTALFGYIYIHFSHS